MPKISRHPVASFYREGVKLVLGTDDPALFGNNTVSHELVASVAAGLTKDEAVALNGLSLKHATRR